MTELWLDLRDPSTIPLNFTKSINLALSERGINSLRESNCDGLLDAILEETIPMHGRMIHGETKDGQFFQESQEYDPYGRVRSFILIYTLFLISRQFIRSIDRSRLNKSLLDALDKMPNVKFYFNHKLTGANFNTKTAWFEQKYTPDTGITSGHNSDQKRQQDRPTEISVNFDLMIGADGAHSSSRYHLMKYAQLNYQQEYIDALWCQFRIEPIRNPSPSFAMSPNHLHIWPGGSFMFIAIPSLDKSFICTLFAPPSLFSHLSSNPTTLLTFFIKNFPGVLPDLITPQALLNQFNSNPHLPLISIKCTPYHFKSSVVILGDAAHAMVPFYGQGMNSGLEDVRVLFNLLEINGVYDDDDLFQESNSTNNNPDGIPAPVRELRREHALAAYTQHRTPDAAAINDLSLRNYHEMRSAVQSPLYLARKWIEERVDLYFPSLGWRTQYSRISFGNERYSDVEIAVRRQSKVLMRVFYGGFGLAGLGGFIVLRILKNGLIKGFLRGRR